MNKRKRFPKIAAAFLSALLLVCVLAVPAFAGVADNTYYNTGCLTSYETNSVSGLAKGTVIVMTPTNNTFYIGSAAEQRVINGQATIVVIPGVGSSSIGAAAFAKHVARIKNCQVAAIVVGYGDGSIYTEGPQGYYIGRSYNIAGMYYTEPASQKLVDMYAAGARPTMLVGHSKGNMDIANALFKMYNEGNQSWYQGVTFKTFGCGVNVPPGLGYFRQYLGSFDSVGAMNTVSYSSLTYVYGRYHTLNPYYYWTYMPIQNYL